MALWLVAIFLQQAWAANRLITMTSITPNTGPTSGSTRVLVRGTNLHPREDFPNPVCKFGVNDNIVKATYVTCTPLPRAPGEPEPTTPEKTDWCIQCDPGPSNEKADDIPFTVSITGDFTDCANSLDFQYYIQPIVDRIVPIYGPKNGRTVITVYGKNFVDYDQYLRCSIGTKSVPAIYLSPTLLYCVAPASDVVVAAMPFRVTMNDQQTTAERIKYWYYPEPAIMKLTPDRGPMTGGNVVMIEGSHLDPFTEIVDEVDNRNDTYCRFGMDYVTPATIYSDILISCIAPPSPIVRTVIVDVTLNNADMVLNPQDWTDDHLPYTYYAPAYVFDVDPRVGPTSGNTTVTVSGSNFKDTGDIKCRFGSKVVPGEFISINEIRCISPAVANPGMVDLSISLVGDEFGKSVKYLYYETPAVERVAPMCGPYTGYTQVTVYGRGFVNTGPGMVKCLFGDIPMDATVMSETVIKCDSPDIHLDEKLNKQVFFPVYVTLNGRDRSRFAGGKPVLFGYYNEHRLKGLRPNRGPITGKTAVNITGEHFIQEGVCNITCRYSTTEVNSTLYNDTDIMCLSPSVKVPGDAIVQVALNGQQYTYYEGVKILRGTTANLGGLYSEVVPGSSSSTSGQSPPGKPDPKWLTFHYYNQPLVNDFHPKAGPSSGNSTILLQGAGFVDVGESASDTTILLRFTDSASGKVLGVTKCFDLAVTDASCLTPAAPAGTKATLEVSKNENNFQPVRNVGKKPEDDYYTFYDAPKISDIDPKSGPVKPDEDRNLTVTGKSFVCPDPQCAHTRCRWGTHPFPIYTSAVILDSHTLKCLIPQLSRPELVEVEITVNGVDYTQDHFNYSYFDAFVLDVTPRIGPRSGGTEVSVHGFGFANTGDKLKCMFGSKENPLLCSGKPCVFKAIYVSDTEVHCVTQPQSQMTFAKTGKGVEDTPFPVEISVDGSKFTSSHIPFQFVEESEVLTMFPSNGTANGGTFMTFTADFKWTNDDVGFERYELFVQHSIIRIKFTNGVDVAIVPGDMSTYPFHFKGLPNAIVCLSPPWGRGEAVKVYVSLNGVDWSRPFDYVFQEKLDLVSISPACGVNRGETKITLRGTGFKDLTNVHLRWGTETRLANQESLFSPTSGMLTAFSAPTPTSRTHGGFIYVEIGQDAVVQDDVEGTYTLYGESTHNKLLYYYYRDPVIKYIYPHSGPNTGGTVVTLAGAWFLNVPSQKCTPKCRFGDKVLDGTFVSTVRVLCPAPAYPETSRAVQVDISFNGVDWTNSGQLFVYHGAPSISYIAPILGPSTGGTMIEIHGKNFTGLANSEEFLCRFRSTSLDMPDKFIPAFFKREDLVYCTSPGGWGSGTAASVEVTFNGHDYTVSNSTFYFFQIDGARPRSGPSTGSPRGIEVYGSGFISNPNATCVLNNTEFKPLSVSWNKMVCPLPAAKSGQDHYGIVPFEVSANGADFMKFPRGFQYFAQPVVTSAEPTHGPASGGSIIALYGKGFKNDFESANLTCSVGSFVGTAMLIDATTIHCITPAMSQGRNETALQVRLSLNGQDYTNNTSTYRIYGLLDSAPKGGPTTGGTQIMIRGFGFFDDHARCRFGIAKNNIVVNGKVLDDGHMVCVSPGDFKVPEGADLPLDIPLEIGFSDSKFNPWTRSDNKYRFYQNPKIKSFAPNNAFVDEKAEVILTSEAGAKSFFPAVTGWHNGELDMMHAIVCRFGDFGTVSATFVSPTEIKCLTPETKLEKANVHSQTVYLEVALNGQDFVTAGEFTFKGTATGLWLVLMWLGIIILCALIMVLLGVCCYYVWQNASMPKWEFSGFARMNVQAGNASQAERPHVFRNPDGFMRPEGSPERPSFHYPAQT